MFPAPSPNTAAIFNLQSGGVTPSTAEFQQSALRAAQATQVKIPATSGPTSQPDTATAGMDRQNNFPALQQPPPRTQADHFANHDVSNAANDLLSFAQQNGSSRNGQQPFSMPQQQQSNAGHMPVQPVNADHSRRNTKGSINSSIDNGDFSDSGQSEEAKTTTRSRSRKGAANGKQAAGSKRKADEPPKGSNRKKSTAQSIGDEEEDTDDESKLKSEEMGGKKMTDEEKRKNFLERNRFVSPLIVVAFITDIALGLPLSSAASARSNGSQTCRPRSSSSARKMMHYPQRLPSCVKRLSISRPYFLPTRTAPFLRLRGYMAPP